MTPGAPAQTPPFPGRSRGRPRCSSGGRVHPVLVLGMVAILAGGVLRWLDARADDAPAVPQGWIAPVPSPPTVVAGIELQPLLERMTVEQKVGQLLLLGFGGTVMDDRMLKLLRDKRPGGLALFQRNIINRAQVRALTDAIRHAMQVRDEVPPFMAVDQEGGNVLRLKNRTTLLPSAMALGATRNATLAETAGRAMGEDLQAHGFNMDFAPVLDVNSNPGNPVIGVRSFGERPDLVAELGSAFIAGLRAAGVAAVAKHFPGHGDTLADSHFSLPVVPHELGRLLDVELAPFKRASSEGLAAVMTAHLALPRVAEEPELPASLSARVLRGLLRHQLGFGGIIMTDGLEMEAVAGRYGAGNAAVRAVKNGADMVMVLWFPERKTEVHEALMEAVASGEIPMARLDDAVLRILGEKAKLGLLGEVPPLPPLPPRSLLGLDEEVAAASVTLLRNEQGILPIPREKSVLIVTPQPSLAKALKLRLPRATSLVLPSSASKERRQLVSRQVARLSRTVDVVVVAVIDGAQEAVVRQLLRDKSSPPVVVVSLGSPYLLARVPGVAAYLCTYSYLRPAQVAAARVLTGFAPARGRLPVTIPGLHEFGDGLIPPAAVQAAR